MTFLCRAREPVHEPHAEAAGARVLPLADRGGLWWEQVALPYSLGGGRHDVYHAPAEHGVPLFTGCPTVLTVHSATAHSYADFIARGLLPGRLADYVGPGGDPDRPTPRNLYWHLQVARADHVIAPSAFAREEIVRLLRVPPLDVTAIPLAVDEVFRRPPVSAAAQAQILARLGIRKPYLLYVGGFERHKNVEGLIAAFALVRAARPDLSLVLVGSGHPTDSVRAAAALADQPGAGTAAPSIVFLHGVVDELVTLYDAAELGVSLSWRESFGLPALEAMTRGVAVVASRWGAAPEVVGDGGALVDPRHPRGFAAAVLALLHDPARGARARAAAARFDWDYAAEATLAVYRRVMRR